MRNKKLTRSKRQEDTVRCECGEEILFVPDVKAMGNTIEIHVALHMQKLKAPMRTDEEAERLRDALITQILSIASQSENDGTKEKKAN